MPLAHSVEKKMNCTLRDCFLPSPTFWKVDIPWFPEPLACPMQTGPEPFLSNLDLSVEAWRAASPISRFCIVSLSAISSWSASYRLSPKSPVLSDLTKYIDDLSGLIDQNLPYEPDLGPWFSPGKLSSSESYAAMNLAFQMNPKSQWDCRSTVILLRYLLSAHLTVGIPVNFRVRSGKPWTLFPLRLSPKRKPLP